MSNRRIGELLMAISGIGLAIGASLIGVPQVAYAGLCITGLGIVSMIWR
ncbi:MAG: hypothetical protein ABJB76_03215 [Candidatus Nitrosocosmicus sp.]